MPIAELISKATVKNCYNVKYENSTQHAGGTTFYKITEWWLGDGNCGDKFLWTKYAAKDYGSIFCDCIDYYAVVGM